MVLEVSYKIRLLFSLFCLISFVSYGQVPNNLPKEELIIGTPDKTDINRAAGNTQPGVKATALTEQEIKNIAKEDSIRNAQLDEAALDLEKAALRKRVFGYSLFSNVTYDAAAQMNISAPSNYVLGPNDELIIDIYGYSQEKYTETINSEGFITIERAGIVKVGGLTLDEANNKIKALLSKIFLGLNSRYGYKPNTFLKVTLGDAKAIKITFTGEVMVPGTFTVNSLTSVLNSLYLVGGPNEIGTYREIKVIRGNKVATILDLYEVIINGFSKSDILLKDQDIIQVGPYVSRVAVNGSLKRQGLFEVLPGETLENLIKFSGGFNQNAYTNKLKVFRNTSTEKKILNVNESEFESFKILNGDSISVEALLPRFENLVLIEGAVFRPGQYSLDNNPTLMDLIKSADGLKNEAFLGRISITRQNDDLTQTNISVNIEDIKKGLASDVSLKREDIIFVPSSFALIEVSTISVQGAVNNTTDAEEVLTFDYIKNTSVEDIIVKAGGLKDGASLTNVEVVRRKKNVNPNDVSAEISEIFKFTISSDLKLIANDTPFILEPFDEVIVRQSPNYAQQEFVVLEGEVLFPGRYGISKKDENIADIIERAGGLTPQAFKAGATLIRPIDLSPEEIEERNQKLIDLGTEGVILDPLTDDNKLESIGIDLVKILKKPKSDENITLADGDLIRIPKKLETVRVQGELLYPSTSKYLPSKKFLDYISDAGGFTKESLASKAYILYPNGSGDRTRRFLFANIYPKVQPGSEIIVPAKVKNTQQQILGFNNTISTITTGIVSILTLISLLKLNN